MELNLSETSDNYKFVIKQIDDKHRIICCEEDGQYISQIKTGGKAQRPWRSVSYYVSKAGAKRQRPPFLEPALSLFPQDASVAPLQRSAQPVDAFMCIRISKAQEATVRVTRSHCESVL